MTLPKYRVKVFFISLLGLVTPIFHARPVLVMIASQALSSVLLPLTVGCIFYLSNRKDLLKEHVNTRGVNLVLITIFALSIINSSIAIKGVWENITDLFAG